MKAPSLIWMITAHLIGSPCSSKLIRPVTPSNSPDVIRRPRLYLRQRAWKHAFAPAPSARGCLRVPVQGQLASRITDAVIERETSSRRPSAFYAMGRYRARGVDLVVRRPSGWRIGFCFEPSRRGGSANPACSALLQALAEGWIDAAILVCCEGEPAIRRRSLLCLPPPVLLAMYHQWTSQATSSEQIEEMLRWLNGQMLLFLGTFFGPEEPQPLDWQFEGLPEEPDDPFLPRPP